MSTMNGDVGKSDSDVKFYSNGRDETGDKDKARREISFVLSSLTWTFDRSSLSEPRHSFPKDRIKHVPL